MSSRRRWRSQTFSIEDANLAIRIGQSESSLCLRGDDLKMARRLVKRGLLQQGRLGDRYFRLTEVGLAFVHTVLSHQEGCVVAAA